MGRRYPTARFRALVAISCLLLIVLVSRFAWIQVVRAEHWRDQARHRSTETVEERAMRGRLLDAAGRVLASDEARVHIGVSRPDRWLADGDVDLLAGVVGMSSQELERQLSGRDRHLRLANSVLVDPATKIRLERDPLITLEEAPRRIHPFGTVAQALIGLVRDTGEGVSGLEAVYDDLLSGRPGRVRERRDSEGQIRDRTPIEEPVDGADLELTLDLHVQGILERELERARVEAGAHRAQGIVMDPWSGDVLALGQVPLLPQPLEDSPDLDPNRVMAAADMFEPGSVFKIFTMGTLLRHAVADTATMFDGGRTSPEQRRAVKEFRGNFRIRDVHPVPVVSLRHAFAVSSNIIFATAALDLLRQEEFHDSLRAFGFGEHVGPAFPGRTRGTLPAVENWSLRTQPTMAIGQRVGVNLLQLASAAAAAITDGDLREPRFVRRALHADGEVRELTTVVRRPGVLPPRVPPVIRELCREAVESEYGTGEGARIDGLSVGGKTGTAQVSNGREYLRGVYTPTFVGFVPVDRPRLLVCVILHRAEGEEVYGGNSAGPCFARVVREIASTTNYLDDAVVRADTVRGERVPTPYLIGRSVDEVRAMAANAAWRISPSELPGVGLVVGQVPPAGTPIRPGARLQLAIAEGRR